MDTSQNPIVNEALSKGKSGEPPESADFALQCMIKI